MARGKTDSGAPSDVVKPDIGTTAKEGQRQGEAANQELQRQQREASRRHVPPAPKTGGQGGI
jgi:hypothetical protein